MWAARRGLRAILNPQTDEFAGEIMSQGIAHVLEQARLFDPATHAPHIMVRTLCPALYGPHVPPSTLLAAPYTLVNLQLLKYVNIKISDMRTSLYGCRGFGATLHNTFFYDGTNV